MSQVGKSNVYGSSKSGDSRKMHEEVVAKSVEKSVLEVIGDVGNFKVDALAHCDFIRANAGDATCNEAQGVENIINEYKADLNTQLRTSTVELFKANQKSTESATTITVKSSATGTTQGSEPNYSLSALSLISPRSIMKNSSKRKEATQLELKNTTKCVNFRNLKLKTPLMRDLESDLHSLKKKYLRAKTDCEVHHRLKKKIIGKILAQREKIETLSGMKRPLDDDLREIEDDYDKSDNEKSQSIEKKNISSEILHCMQSTLEQERVEKQQVENHLKMLEHSLRDREDLIENLKARLRKAMDDLKLSQAPFADEMEILKRDIIHKSETIENQYTTISHLNNTLSEGEKKSAKKVEEFKFKIEELTGNIKQLEKKLLDVVKKLESTRLKEITYKKEIARIDCGTDTINRITLEVDLIKKQKELKQLKSALTVYQREESEISDQLNQIKGSSPPKTQQHNKEWNASLQEKMKALLEVQRKKKITQTGLYDVTEEINQLKDKIYKINQTIKEKVVQFLSEEERKKFEDKDDKELVSELYTIILKLRNENTELNEKINKFASTHHSNACFTCIENEKIIKEFSIAQEKWEKREKELTVKILFLKRKIEDYKGKVAAQSEKISKWEMREAALCEGEDLRAMYTNITKILKSRQNLKAGSDVLCRQLESQQRKITDLERSVAFLEEHEEQMQWQRVQLEKKVALLKRKGRLRTPKSPSHSSKST